MATLPRTVTHEEVVCGVPTKFALTLYSNRVFVVLTQTENLGTMVRALLPSSRRRCTHNSLSRCSQIQAHADSPLDAGRTSYSTRVLFGRRDDEALEVYARTLVELISKRSPTAGPLLLAISIREHSAEMFRSVMRVADATLLTALR